VKSRDLPSALVQSAETDPQGCHNQPDSRLLELKSPIAGPDGVAGNARFSVCNPSSPKNWPTWNLLAVLDVSSWSAALSFEISMPLSECTMNIFYIIGVIVVVLFVAGFFGLHA
jgi:hypothetical protein